MDPHRASRPLPLRQASEADGGGGPSPAARARARRPALREQRHPNAVTAPPLQRGSMPTRPWTGFWAGLASGLLLAASGLLGRREATAAAPRQPWERAAARRRAAFLAIAGASSVVATVLYAGARPDDTAPALAAVQVALFAILSAWVVTGFVTALMGFWVTLRGDRHGLSVRAVQDHVLAADARTAIVMPICEEHVPTVFAGLRATCESLMATGQAARFDVFVLSDSSTPAQVAAERAAWEDLRAALAEQSGAPVEVYLRHRQRRTHRKAGNVADFCRRWGRDYRYMVVLDADSVMSGDCLVTLAKLMEAHPRAGILQTATQPIGHATLHARAQQFAARLTGRLFTLGLQYWQLGESHYWGHNAILRLEPFMQHCGLAPLPGRGGLSGGILSHDFVEAALMRRAGYQVWLVPDLEGSYEQQPPDLLSELQRDRRWCQGNLMNARLVAEPGLHRVHRAMLAIGAMSYLAAPLWLAFLVSGAALWLSGGLLDGGMAASRIELVGLWLWALCMLFLPRVLGLIAVLLRGEQAAFGGTARLLVSAAFETALALLQAPVRMAAHALFVVVALTGIRLHWTSPPREATALAWGAAAQRLLPLSAVVAAAAAALATTAPHALAAVLPVAVPLLLSVPMAVFTSDARLGATLRARGLLLIPEEAGSPAVLRRAGLHAGRAARLLRAA
ncbi:MULTISPECIES: glucans biosynthesis glucosyltransferase MdoH [Ramlibacter]|uniref:Glucans biosynthesis glucosyltransferase H n=1 Tax=Ramlibacter pinisoli TaxID=2682844 RepID=A0A6N8IU61_9BURK|nr:MULTISPECIES: glucans biosynthesis glucosyltransferase MdoH [Ramlibacter]MBA2965278.1 glucans biosynthesis glucosyltransferase MdoH [Ramlibacter sp. CGMCC 1.13660]MVQ30242.1 glucans biosynthesis glucosyltransferase MdoH [Ramlibacter pinisoli]